MQRDTLAVDAGQHVLKKCKNYQDSTKNSNEI